VRSGALGPEVVDWCVVNLVIGTPRHERPQGSPVLSFRLLTRWIPIIPGYLAFRNLAKRELL
jgi:hypothetical protein